MATPNHPTQDNQRSSAITSAGASIGNNEDVRQAKNLFLLGHSLERQAARNATEEEMKVIVEELRAMREQMAEVYVRKARKFAAVEDQILSILHRSSQSVTRSGFGEPAIEQQMKARLRPILERNGILMLPLLMGGGKVANPLKVGPSYLPDLSEWISWSHLEAIGLALSAVNRKQCEDLNAMKY